MAFPSPTSAVVSDLISAAVPGLISAVVPGLISAVVPGLISAVVLGLIWGVPGPNMGSSTASPAHQVPYRCRSPDYSGLTEESTPMRATVSTFVVGLIVLLSPVCRSDTPLEPIPAGASVGQTAQ
jgi:hypothetical protein